MLYFRSAVENALAHSQLMAPCGSDVVCAQFSLKNHLFDLGVQGIFFEGPYRSQLTTVLKIAELCKLISQTCIVAILVSLFKISFNSESKSCEQFKRGKTNMNDKSKFSARMSSSAPWLFGIYSSTESRPFPHALLADLIPCRQGEYVDIHVPTSTHMHAESIWVTQLQSSSELQLQ